MDRQTNGSSSGSADPGTITLTLPSRPTLLTLVRFAAATLAVEADFSVDEIDDLRLAVDELCLSIGGGEKEGTLELEFSRRDGVIEVVCTADLEIAPAFTDDSDTSWSLQILDALVDEHGRETIDDRCRAWLRKRPKR